MTVILALREINHPYYKKRWIMETSDMKNIWSSLHDQKCRSISPTAPIQSKSFGRTRWYTSAHTKYGWNHSTKPSFSPMRRSRFVQKTRMKPTVSFNATLGGTASLCARYFRPNHLRGCKSSGRRTKKCSSQILETTRSLWRYWRRSWLFEELLYCLNKDWFTLLSIFSIPKI